VSLKSSCEIAEKILTYLVFCDIIKIKGVQRIIEELGSNHNLALVRISSSKKCLFVEGKDVKILSKLQAILNIHSQQPIDTLPCISLGGASKLNEAFDASKLFHAETQEHISCYCILDRDYFTDEYIDNNMKSAKEVHLNLHVWKKKEIENYLLIPRAIFRIVDKPESEYEIFLEKLNELIDRQKEETILKFADKLQTQDGKKKDLGLYFKEAKGNVNSH
jgi:hypothetical protein